jgi:phosphate starvation-inducible PhoH-like protein
VIVRKFPVEHLEPLTLLGHNDVNLRQIEKSLPVRITLRDGTITVAGEEDAVGSASKAIQELVGLAESGKLIEEADVATALGATRRNGNGAKPLAESYEGAPGYSFDRKAVRARTPMQAEYLKSLEEHEVVFAIGPAGTGKTYLAVAAAVHALRQKKVDRIILVRPAVEAGESLGFLPGDMQEKVNPYLRPLYDALYDMLDTERVARYIERGTIEIAPIAFMRGRTLNDSFVILDEAQNTTSEQMKMFLTRLGFGAKAVITGDITQIDLPIGRTSGLVEAMKVVGSIEGISFIHFDDRDVVRHKLVQQIVKAYEKFSNGHGRAS